MSVSQSELKTSKNKSKKAQEAEAKAEEEAATKAGGCSNKTVKFDNLINPKTLKAFDKKNVRMAKRKRRITYLTFHRSRIRGIFRRAGGVLPFDLSSACVTLIPQSPRVLVRNYPMMLLFSPMVD